MRIPHFLRLAEIDGQRFITACRSGVVHVTWGRTTTRFAEHEFRALAELFSRAAAQPGPRTLGDEVLSVVYRPGEDCEVRLGSLVLLISPADFQLFAGAVRDAVHRLEQIQAAGVWDREEPEGPPAGFPLGPGHVSFSNN